MNKPKILIICDGGLDHGGIQAVIMTTVRNLANEYVFDVLVSTKTERFFDKEFLSYGGKILRIPRYEGLSVFKHHIDVLLYRLIYCKKIKKLIKDNGPYKAIHCHNNYDASIMLKIAADCKIPIRIIQAHVVTKLGKGHIPRKIFNWVSRIGFKYSNVRIGCSEEACRSLYGSMNYRIVRNPYNEKIFDYKRYSQSDTNELVLIQVGSFSNNKNQAFTIRCLELIKKKYCNASLQFVGFELEEGYLQRLYDEIDTLGLRNNVKFYSHNADIPCLLNESSYFIFPSISEGFGIVLIEAQSMGLKCFVSNTVPTLTNCGGCIYLPIGDNCEELWAKTIFESFLQDKGRHNQYDCTRFSTEEYLKIIRNIYQGNNGD